MVHLAYALANGQYFLRTSKIFAAPSGSQDRFPGDEPKNQKDHENSDRDKEQPFGNGCCARGDAAETEKSGDNGDNEKKLVPISALLSYLIGYFW